MRGKKFGMSLKPRKAELLTGGWKSSSDRVQVRTQPNMAGDACELRKMCVVRAILACRLVESIAFPQDIDL